ncbi:MAG: RidA family protein [Pseudomonadota bacterium]
MKTSHHSAQDAVQPYGNYAQCLRISEFSELAFVSGQGPERLDGTVPTSFRQQADLVWLNIDAQLRAAGMTRRNIVRATTYLRSQSDAAENRAARDAFLGEQKVAMTLVFCDLFVESWMIEIDVIAAG